MLSRLTAPRLLLLPWVVLVTMLSVTWLIWDHEHQIARKALRAQFDFSLYDTVSRIEQRVASYEQMLHGVQGLFATTPLTNRVAVRNYIEKLQLDANFSGVQAIGVVMQVPFTQKASHIARMRRTGFSDYKIHPEGERKAYAPIVQREFHYSHHSNNHAPLGLDIWADPVRRLALERSRDSGMAAITGKVQLAVDKSVVPEPGFIMYLPIYTQGKSSQNITKRRTNLIGWVYASFHMKNFMASLYGSPASGIGISIYDGTNSVDSALMHQININNGAIPKMTAKAEGMGSLNTNEYMVVAGQTWTLKLSTHGEFQDRFGRNSGFIIAIAGICLSLSMALLVWFMVTGRARALQLAAEMTEELRRMAQYDLLTSLPNRNLLSDRINQELARAKRYGGKFALIFLDLDKVKPVNDNFGHLVGDLLLQQVAQRLQDSIRTSDTVGRIGGDEFVVLIPELMGVNAVLVLAEKIRCALEQTFVVDHHELAISCSIGIAIYPENGADEIALTKSADEAMYHAKDSGRNSVQLAS